MKQAPLKQEAEVFAASRGRRRIDNAPGDRAGDCLGLMKPVGVRWHSKKGWQIIHRCEKCGAEKVNRAATDTAQPDDLEIIRKLSAKGGAGGKKY